MRVSIFSVFILGLFFLSSCNQENLNTDDNIIASILADDNKSSIEISDLPTEVTSVLEEELTESYYESGQHSRSHGYVIYMRRDESSYIGERNELFFDLEGRELFRGGIRKIRRLGECGRDRNECFQLVFPVTFIMPDGSEITGETRPELRMAIRAWYEANPTADERPDLQFPVELEYQDGTIVTIEDSEALRTAFQECREENGFNRCFVFVYPITYIMPDGTEISGDSREEIGMAIRAWYEDNPGEEGHATLQFPIEIEYEDGSIETINGKEELRTAFSECE